MIDWMKESWRRAFVTGVAVGALLIASAVAGAAQAVRRQGVELTVPIEPIAEQVRTAVREAALRELPQAMTAARQELPRRVAGEVARRLLETRVEVAGFSVPVPASAVQVVESKTEEALRAGIDMAIRQADIDATATRLGDQAARLVRERMTQAISGQRFVVRPWPWYPIPVTVRPERP